MKKLIFYIVLSFVFIFNVKSQPFKVSVDTLYLNIKDIVRPAAKVDLTHAIKYKGKYYCFFEENGLYSFRKETKYLFIISQNGKIEHNIPVPKEIDEATYYDFFIRNDSILAKPYLEQQSYCLDPVDLKWKKINMIDDRVYEDDKFIITYIDNGEWGVITQFQDKKTKISFNSDIASTTVNTLNGKYYLTNGTKIREIEDPRNLSQNSTGEHTGSTVIYDGPIYSRWDFKEPKQWIITSFANHNQLLQLYSDSISTYIVQVEDNSLIPIQDLGKKYSVFNWHYSFRGENQDNENRFLMYKENQNVGFMEINKNNTIDIHYLRTDLDSLKYLGSDGFDKLLHFLIKNIANLPLQRVKSFENKLGGIDMKTDKKGTSHNTYYPNKNNFNIEGTKEYIKIEDKIITNKTEYFYTLKDSLVKGVFLEWCLTKPYNTNNTINLFSDSKPEIVNRFKTKFNEIEQIISKRTGLQPIKIKEKNNYIQLTWITDKGITVELYGSETFNSRKEIRMVIYKN